MISKQIEKNLEQSSWVRRMFEEGTKLIEEYGAENVYDFSIGNPYFEPPKEVVENIRKYANSDALGTHRYMNNAGYPEVRDQVAAFINEDTEVPLTRNNICMTVGAAGALNVTMKTLLDPGDEVIIITPFFGEYIFITQNHGGVTKVAEADPETFQLNIENIEKVMTEKTKVILINSPNNPTGVIYSEASLKALAALIERKEKEYNKDIYLLSDEPYKAITYDQATVPNVHNIFKNSIVVNSFSKSLGLAGDRIGYIAFNSKIDHGEALLAGLVFANRTLGFVNAPAMFQKVVGDSLHASVDINEYAKRRELLYNRLTEMGYEVVKPEGAFYLFPKALIEDDVAFIDAAKKYNLLLVPGSGFGYKGHFRMSYCVDYDMIERSLPLFEKLINEFK